MATHCAPSRGAPCGTPQTPVKGRGAAHYWGLGAHPPWPERRRRRATGPPCAWVLRPHKGTQPPRTAGAGQGWVRLPRTKASCIERTESKGDMERAGGGRATEKVPLSAPLQVSKFFPFHLKLQMQRTIHPAGTNRNSTRLEHRLRPAPAPRLPSQPLLITPQHPSGMVHSLGHRGSPCSLWAQAGSPR